MSSIRKKFNVLILMSAMFLVGHMFGDRVLTPPVYKLHGKIEPYMSEQFREWILALSDGQQATLRIETYGGHLTSGYKIAHYVRTTKADLTCIVDSHAMSAGALILQSCRKIIMTPTSTMLYHLPRFADRSSMSGYRIVSSDHPTFKTFMKEVDKVGLLTKSERARMMEGEDIYISGSEVMKRLKEKR